MLAYKILYNLFLIALLLPAHLNATKLPVMRGIGGNFTAASSLGHEFKLSDYKNNVILLTFVFTNCPDICPVTLGYLDYVYGKLTRQQQAKTKILFITVNPEQDTPAYLRKYLDFFNKDFIGVSILEPGLAKIAKMYGVEYSEVAAIIPTRYNRPLIELDIENTAKMFNHSISIFLLDKYNRVRGIYYSGSDADKLSGYIGELLLEKDLLTRVSYVQGQQQLNDALTTKDFWLRWVPPVAQMTALYGKVINHSKQLIYITGVFCDIAKHTELHVTKFKGGYAKMVSQRRIAIQANSVLELKPMSYHIMLMGLKSSLIQNQQIKCQLQFSNHEKKSITATIMQNK